MRPRFNPWVGEIPRRREWLSTPVFLPGEFLAWAEEPSGPPSTGSQSRTDRVAETHNTHVVVTGGSSNTLGLSWVKDATVPWWPALGPSLGPASSRSNPGRGLTFAMLSGPYSWAGSGPDLRPTAPLWKADGVFLASPYVFLPHPSPKCFPVLIYLAKEVCGERHQTGNSCHSCCLQRLFF